MLKIVTFNIRCQPYLDGINAFIHRAGYIFDKIQKENPDVICFQEVVPFQLDMLKKMMPEYSFYGRYNGKKDELEGLFIAVKNDKLEVVGFETIWLSPTPYVCGSRFEEASPYPRICVMTYLRDKETEKEFRVYNTHLDHRSEEARNKGLSIILDFITEQNKKLDLPLVLLGDFNAQVGSATVQMCKDYVDATADINGSFHDFGRRPDYGKIDYMFVTPNLKVSKAIRWEDCHEGIFLSDHYPIALEIEL
ncbi:MAG: endonuclease/exonuclease/phosphatase family protein [Clostridia bacterium]|nr:endonuclease/exonuclease/phosphatase family protein [Clostridia bacterium]